MSAETVFAYHHRTMHRRTSYAAGPETIDWSSPPDPFRRFAGAPLTLLPLGAEALAGTYDALLAGNLPPQPVNVQTLGYFLQLSMAISAWKQAGPDRWAVRVTPSSGNLHPTETYVLASGIEGMADGVHHYAVDVHGLEQRFAPHAPAAQKGLWIGLSSIAWREAWKYGERAFRYCQLDTGHAIAALRYAAALLGWRLRLVPTDAASLDGLLGLDRAKDFSGVEPEDGEVLLQITSNTAVNLPNFGEGVWQGKAGLLDPHPMYHWPVIEEAAEASRQSVKDVGHTNSPEVSGPSLAAEPVPAAALILNRRSAQRFDSGFTLPAEDFFRILDRLQHRATPPFDVWDFVPRLHPLIFVHRVSDVPPGVYFLPQREGVLAPFQAACDGAIAFEKHPAAPAHLPLYKLVEGDFRRVARSLSCLQAIAGDSAFSLGLIAEFGPIVQHNPWRYRQLHWEAGLLGQVLYLEAESMGLAGTGIGCFFDDEVHGALGLSGADFQSLYHFTLGMRLADTRISTEAAYPNR